MTDRRARTLTQKVEDETGCCLQDLVPQRTFITKAVRQVLSKSLVTTTWFQTSDLRRQCPDNYLCCGFDVTTA